MLFQCRIENTAAMRQPLECTSVCTVFRIQYTFHEFTLYFPNLLAVVVPWFLKAGRQPRKWEKWTKRGPCVPLRPLDLPLGSTSFLLRPLCILTYGKLRPLYVLSLFLTRCRNIEESIWIYTVEWWVIDRVGGVVIWSLGEFSVLKYSNTKHNTHSTEFLTFLVQQ